MKDHEIVSALLRAWNLGLRYQKANDVDEEAEILETLARLMDDTCAHNKTEGKQL